MSPIAQRRLFSLRFAALWIGLNPNHSTSIHRFTDPALECDYCFRLQFLFFCIKYFTKLSNPIPNRTNTRAMCTRCGDIVYSWRMARVKVLAATNPGPLYLIQKSTKANKNHFIMVWQVQQRFIIVNAHFICSTFKYILKHGHHRKLWLLKFMQKCTWLMKNIMGWAFIYTTSSIRFIRRGQKIFSKIKYSIA